MKRGKGNGRSAGRGRPTNPPAPGHPNPPGGHGGGHGMSRSRQMISTSVVSAEAARVAARPSPMVVIKKGGARGGGLPSAPSDGAAQEVSEADLASVQFGPRATFSRNEVVLVPRSRGGFSYGVVTRHSVELFCPWGELEAQPSPRGQPKIDEAPVAPLAVHMWRVVYAVGPGSPERLCKFLPSFALGKIPRTKSTQVLPTHDLAMSNPNGREELLLEGEEILWEPGRERLTRTDTHVAVSPTLRGPAPGRDAAPVRVGSPPHLADIRRALFAYGSTFEPEELVLSKRSNGGLTYARVVSQVFTKCPYCPLLHRGYRIRVNKDSEPLVLKEVLPIGIGKLFESTPWHGPKPPTRPPPMRAASSSMPSSQFSLEDEDSVHVRGASRSSGGASLPDVLANKLSPSSIRPFFVSSPEASELPNPHSQPLSESHLDFYPAIIKGYVDEDDELDSDRGPLVGYASWSKNSSYSSLLWPGQPEDLEDEDTGDQPEFDDSDELGENADDDDIEPVDKEMHLSHAFMNHSAPDPVLEKIPFNAERFFSYQQHHSHAVEEDEDDDHDHTLEVGDEDSFFKLLE